MGLLHYSPYTAIFVPFGLDIMGENKEIRNASYFKRKNLGFKSDKTIELRKRGIGE